MRTRSIGFGIVGIAASIILWSAMAVPASADWAYGNGFTGLDVVGNGPPDSFGNPQVCANRIKGRVGNDTQPPPGPWSASTVQIFATTEDLAGAVPEAGGLRTQSGVLVPPAGTQTTAELTQLSPFETYEDFQGETHTVYAAAAFNFAPSASAVHPGDNIAVKIQGRSAFVTRRAVSCPPGTK